jgi:hypothetical protein
MSTIRIETHIDSETLFLPQLKPMVGKDVEIVVREKSIPIISPGRSAGQVIESDLLELDDYDFDAYRAARECEVRQINGKSA